MNVFHIRLVEYKDQRAIIWQKVNRRQTIVSRYQAAGPRQFSVLENKIEC